MPELNPVVSQEGALVGDEAVQEHVHKVEPEVVSEAVDAQVVATPQPAADKVNVHETSVQLDTVITDPSSPLAVQVPDAGRGSLDLPIHALDAPTVEEVFAEHAASIEERDTDASVPGAASEPNPAAHEGE
jgi:hypothetical protein